MFYMKKMRSSSLFRIYRVFSFWLMIIQAALPEVIHEPRIARTVMQSQQQQKHNMKLETSSKQLRYNGGSVIKSPKVYLTFWGSQWNNNDPSNEAGILQSFFSGLGGSLWLNTVTQYCSGAAVGSISCSVGHGQVPESNPSKLLYGVWYDNAARAPSAPTDRQIAAEALKTALHFGNNVSDQNAGALYFVMTASGNNSVGFGTSYCAYHSWSQTPYGNITYANMPYLTDVGYACGAGFNGFSNAAGFTIIAGHELAEMMTDPSPLSGWLDRNNSEIGDNCNWIATGTQGAVDLITLSTGSFPVQSLWSNAFNGVGGCVLEYSTYSPTSLPSMVPTHPTLAPSLIPTSPTLTPSFSPTSPTLIPSSAPSLPTIVPTVFPTVDPSFSPSLPTLTPSTSPSIRPSVFPSAKPSRGPSRKPSSRPITFTPTRTPSAGPTAPTIKPTRTPTSVPSTFAPSSRPTLSPTGSPTIAPSIPPTSPSIVPSRYPTARPSKFPSYCPSKAPSKMPSATPLLSMFPTTNPSVSSSRPSVVSVVQQQTAQPSVSSEPSLSPVAATSNLNGGTLNFTITVTLAIVIPLIVVLICLALAFYYRNQRKYDQVSTEVLPI